MSNRRNARTAVIVEPRSHASRFSGTVVVGGGENRVMAVSAAGSAWSRLSHVLRSRFGRRAWSDLGYAIVSFPLALAGYVFTVVTCCHPVLLFVSTPAVRGLGAVN